MRKQWETGESRKVGVSWSALPALFLRSLAPAQIARACARYSQLRVAVPVSVWEVVAVTLADALSEPLSELVAAMGRTGGRGRSAEVNATPVSKCVKCSERAPISWASAQAQAPLEQPQRHTQRTQPPPRCPRLRLQQGHKSPGILRNPSPPRQKRDTHRTPCLSKSCCC
jgi:hypothetical protein